MVFEKKVKSNLIIKGNCWNGYSKGKWSYKIREFCNKDIIKEEAEILTNLLDDITKNLVRPKPFDKIRGS